MDWNQDRNWNPHRWMSTSHLWCGVTGKIQTQCAQNLMGQRHRTDQKLTHFVLWCRYCDCFANGEFCHNCNCAGCANNLDHEEERSRAIKSCLDRNPYAFHPKIGKFLGFNKNHEKPANVTLIRTETVADYKSKLLSNIKKNITCPRKDHRHLNALFVKFFNFIGTIHTEQ